MPEKTIAPNLTVAEHIAAHFALDMIAYDLRESEYTGNPEAEWEPATTAAELMAALEHSGKLAKSADQFVIPGYAVRIGENGEEFYDNADDVTEFADRLNAVLVLLAESVALRKASNDAMARAVGLRELYGLNDHSEES